MNEEKITWYPYPEYKPKKDGEYMVQWKDGLVYIGFDSWESGGWRVLWESDVIAWAYKPKGYKRVKDE